MMQRKLHMSLDHLNSEIADEVTFSGAVAPGLPGVMGIQDRDSVCPIRHASKYSPVSGGLGLARRCSVIWLRQ